MEDQKVRMESLNFFLSVRSLVVMVTTRFFVLTGFSALGEKKKFFKYFPFTLLTDPKTLTFFFLRIDTPGGKGG